MMILVRNICCCVLLALFLSSCQRPVSSKYPYKASKNSMPGESPSTAIANLPSQEEGGLFSDDDSVSRVSGNTSERKKLPTKNVNKEDSFEQIDPASLQQVAQFQQNQAAHCNQRQKGGCMTSRRESYYRSRDTRVNNLYEAGRACERANDIDGAISNFNEAIQLDSNYGPAFFERATCRMALKQYSDAISDLNNTISVLPENCRAYDKRGTCYMELRDFHKALSDMERAQSLYSEQGYPDWAQSIQPVIDELRTVP